MGTLVQRLYSFRVILVFFVTMIILLPGIMIPFLLGQRFSWIGYKFLALWSWMFSKLNFISYSFQGMENIQRGKPYIFVSNHTSFLDIPGLTMMISGEFRPLAKKELLRIPIFGWIVRSATVVVDRSSPESRRKSMELLKKILNRDIPLLIFAEGTQNRTKELLQPFKDGAFRIAIDTQKPIVPVVVLGAGALMPPGTFSMKPGKIRIVVGKEIPVEGLSANDVSALKEKTYSMMQGMMEQNL